MKCFLKVLYMRSDKAGLPRPASRFPSAISPRGEWQWATVRAAPFFGLRCKGKWGNNRHGGQYE